MRYAAHARLWGSRAIERGKSRDRSVGDRIHNLGVRPAALCWTLRRGACPSCQTYLLTAFLALSGDRATGRAQLAGLLWPEEDADKSHANLRQLIARIRAQQASLGFRLVDATPSTIRLAPVNVRIDLADILERLRSRRPEDIQELCSLYGGDLLEDAERETDAGRDWIALRRAHLRETVTGALCRFLEEESGADDQLILAAERLLEIDPYQEAGYRGPVTSLRPPWTKVSGAARLGESLPVEAFC